MASIPINCGECGYSTEHETHFECAHPDGELKGGDASALYTQCPIKEDELDALRFRVKYREQSFYLTVSFKDGIPWELFAEHPMNGDLKLNYMLSSWDAICRLSSAMLKTHGVEKVIKQLSRSSRQKSDLPGLLSHVLSQVKFFNKALGIKHIVV